MLTRRTFLQAIGAGVAVAAFGGCEEIRPTEARTAEHAVHWHTVTWSGDHAVRVAQLTDVHVGRFTSDRLLDSALRTTWRARPDLVVLTGDYLNYDLRYLPDLQRFVRSLPRPCVATLGNHDYWSGARGITDMLTAQGVTVLANDSALIDAGGTSLTVVGVDDGYTDHANVAKAFARVKAPEQALVLSHFPEIADRIVDQGGRLVLSGHTHGGYVNIPYATPLAARVTAGCRYLSGWYTVGDGQLYVSPGLGSASINLRVGRAARPEVAVFDLIPADQAAGASL